MSKVLSFSVPDSWLDGLASLYPNETPNLAAKKALGDILSGFALKFPSDIVLDDYLTKTEFEEYTASNLRELDNIASKIEHLTDLASKIEHLPDLSSKLNRLDELKYKVQHLTNSASKVENLPDLVDQSQSIPEIPVATPKK
jgi:hypothetical protein